MAETPEAPNEPSAARPAIPGAAPRQNALDAFSPHQKSRRGLAGFKRMTTDGADGTGSAGQPTPVVVPISADVPGGPAPAGGKTPPHASPTRREALLASVTGWVDRYQKFMAAHARQLQEANIRHTKIPKLSDESRDRFAENWNEVAAEGPPPPRPLPPLSPSRAFFLKLPLTRWMFSGRRLDRVIAGGVLVLLIGVPLTWHLTRHARDAPAAEAAPRLPEAREWDEIDAGWDVGRKFLSAADLKEASQFVRQREQTGSRMKSWHQQFTWRPREDASLFTAEVFPGRVTLYVEAAEKTEPQVLTLLWQEGQYAVDWEASSGWQETGWPNLVPSPAPIRLRAIARKSDYYNFAFADGQKFAARRLTLPYSTEVVYGYARRDSPVDNQLQERLGRLPFVAAEFLAQVPPDFPSRRQVELLEVVQMGWFPALEGDP